MPQVVKENGSVAFSHLVDIVQNVEDATSMSLFQYAKRSIVNSRVYIARSLSTEEILTPLMLNTMNLYAGLILTAMSMNRMVSSTKKVRDAMSIVATEGFDQPAPYYESTELMNNFFGALPGMEDIDILDTAGRTIEGREPEDYGYSAVSKSTIVDTEPKNVNLPSGRVIQISFGSDKQRDTSGAFTVNLYLQLTPRFIPGEVADQFVSLNFTPSVKQRWMQASVGEISFIKDFIMGLDQRKARRKAMKKDNTGALRDMIERQENSLSNYYLKLLRVTPERQNIANSILIFEKDAFERACSKSGLRFKNYNNRQKFFNKTFAMMLHVVDPMFNKVTTYYHGLDAISEFSFDQIKRNSKTENVDLIQVMKAYAQGMAPKF